MVKQHLKFETDDGKRIANSSASFSPGPSNGAANIPRSISAVHADDIPSNGTLTGSRAKRTVPEASHTNRRKRAVDFFDGPDESQAKQSKDEHTNGTNGITTHTGSAQSPDKRRKILEERSRLPISRHVKILQEKVRDNNVIILLGETGSGKSTQLPQFLLQTMTEGCIAVTQPRRVAAINLARRVSEEMSVKLGHEVGYSIRFDDTSSRHTKIKYLTDGMLLIELLRDPILSKYSVVILDEAHERTLLTDLLLGFMKALLKRRIGMKVVVMSATLDTGRFSSFFDDAEIVQIEGRTFPVELYYSRVPQTDYIDAVLRSVFQVHMGQATGDVLVFLTGSDEIENLCRSIREYSEQLNSSVPKLLALPLYASLSQAEQSRVFLTTPKNTRKVILSTNVAETSITVPGVRYVIDAGLQKIKSYNAKIGFESLEVSPISQSNANQRTGRAGREAPGKCWRLYQESTYDSLPKTAEAEIKRVELSQAILALKARGVSDVLAFDYIDPPSRESLVRALEHLYSLSALDDTGSITSLGKSMSTIPLSPALARVLLAAQKEDCVSEVIDIVSCLSVDGIFLDRSDQREEIAESRKRFAAPEGDHLTLLNVIRAYMDIKEGLSKWCDDSFLDKRAMRTVLDIRTQLLQHATRAHLTLTQSPTTTKKTTETTTTTSAESERILRAFLTGFITHTAFLSPDGSYRTTQSNTAVSIHPASTLYGTRNECIVYHESVFTTRVWVRGVSRVQGAWVRDVAPAWTGRSSA